MFGSFFEAQLERKFRGYTSYFAKNIYKVKYINRIIDEC